MHGGTAALAYGGRSEQDTVRLKWRAWAPRGGGGRKKGKKKGRMEAEEIRLQTGRARCPWHRGGGNAQLGYTFRRWWLPMGRRGRGRWGEAGRTSNQAEVVLRRRTVSAERWRTTASSSPARVFQKQKGEGELEDGMEARARARHLEGVRGGHRTPPGGQRPSPRSATTCGSRCRGGPGRLGQMDQKGGRGPFSKRKCFSLFVFN
jgi:hypothetical protein